MEESIKLNSWPLTKSQGPTDWWKWWLGSAGSWWVAPNQPCDPFNIDCGSAPIFFILFSGLPENKWLSWQWWEGSICGMGKWEEEVEVVSLSPKGKKFGERILDDDNGKPGVFGEIGDELLVLELLEDRVLYLWIRLRWRRSEDGSHIWNL